jgi:hypothetical protein
VTYSSTRDDEQLRYLEARVQQFILRYTNSTTPPAERLTLILFAGGMGSQLLRAKTPYQDGGPVNQTFNYDKVWLTVWSLVQDALYLKMHVGAGGVFRDLQDRIIIADDSVELFGITPYTLFTYWCESKNIDWFIYGWDWRRPLDEIADFFVDQFLPAFQNTVQTQTGNDPLNKFVLVGHSAGGMALDLVLRKNDTILDGLQQAISVAAPFYGYGGQLHRYFEGEPYLNDGLGTVNVIKTIASFPGCYALQYMDVATYTANAAAFAVGPYKLLDYPSKDATAPANNVDPYAPGPNRYPTNLDFSNSDLGAGLTTYLELAAGPTGVHAADFYNIRGVQATNGTVGGISWAYLTTPYVPGVSPSPITDDATPVPGDGVQPAWTARLLTLPASHYITIKGNIDHMFMMEYPATQAQIATLIGV